VAARTAACGSSNADRRGLIFAEGLLLEIGHRLTQSSPPGCADGGQPSVNATHNASGRDSGSEDTPPGSRARGSGRRSSAGAASALKYVEASDDWADDDEEVHGQDEGVWPPTEACMVACMQRICIAVHIRDAASIGCDVSARHAEAVVLAWVRPQA